MLESVKAWAEWLMTALGYPGLALVMFLENVFPPIPSEVILPLAGSLTVGGPFTLPGVALAGVCGSVAGAWVFYLAGRWLDESRLRRLLRRHGKWLLLRESDLDRALDWFRRYGECVVFFGRMVPVVRSLISVPAGIACMDPFRFTLYTTLGTAGWSLALALAGRLLGQGWSLVSDLVGRFQDLTVAAIILSVMGLFLVRFGQQLYVRLRRE